MPPLSTVYLSTLFSGNYLWGRSMTDDLDIRKRLRAARYALNFAWTTWNGMAQPASVTLRARIVVGEDWLSEHPGKADQARGAELIAKLRAQAHEEELAESVPGAKRNQRRAWDTAEARFLDAEREYLRLVSDASERGIPEPTDGE